MADTLKKLGDTAKKYVEGFKSLTPSDSDVQGLKATQQNVDQATAKSPDPAPRDTTVYPQDKVNPARYGTRPGEKVIDTKEMLKPLPSYDQGGTVPEDQVAKLHEGEEVLPPEEAEQYRKEKEAGGAPAGFPGIVLPNPRGIEPVLDTDIKPEVEKITGGAKMSTDNAPAKTLEGDVSNPPKADMGAQGTEISAKEPPKAKPFEQLVEDKANEKAKDIASAQAEGGGAATGAAQPEEKPKMTYGNILADQWMQRNGMKLGSMEQGAKMPGSEPGLQPYGNVEEGATKPKALQTDTGVAQSERPGMKPINLEPTAAPAAAAEPAKGYKAKIADLKQQHTDALAERTPAGQEKADRIEAQIQDLQKNNPWGSATNHPGILGKIGHYGSLIGNIAGDVAIPSVMRNIPGTDMYKQAATQGVRQRLEKEVPQVTARATEEANADSAKREGTPQQQYINDQATLRAAQAKGDPKAIAEAQGAVDADIKAAELGKAPVKEATPENRLADANMALQAAQKSGDANAIAKAQGDVKAITDAINAKTSVATTPATSEQVAEYGNRIKQLALTPEQEKVYGTAPAGTTTAELDKRYTEAQSLKNIADKEAETKVTNQARKDVAADKKKEEAGKVYDKYNTQLEKVKTPADATAARAGLAVHNLDLNTKQADSLVAPEILTLAAGGQGSGLRMNEAEIKRIVGGRSVWDGIVARANQIKEEGGTFDDTQRQQLRQIATYIQERSAGISSVLDKAREKMLSGAENEDAVRKAYNEGNRIASAISRQGIVPEGGVHSPGDFIMFNGEVMIIDQKGKGHPVMGD